MSRVLKFTDTAVFQSDTVGYFKLLRRFGAVFNFTKLTEGVNYTNPKAFNQINASRKVFGSHGAGVYHFYHGESAAYFLRQFRKTGLDPKTTKFALDLEAVELEYRDNTAGVNAFLRQLVRYGFRPGNIWVYVSQSWVNQGWFKPRFQAYGFVWLAMYPSVSGYFNNSLKPNSAYNPHANAWQFSGIGVHQDWSYDYTGTLLTPNLEEKVPKKRNLSRKGGSSYLRHGHVFTTLSTVNGYKDLMFRDGQNGLVLGKGSKFPGKIIDRGSWTRIQSKYGYFTANRKYVKAAK